MTRPTVLIVDDVEANLIALDAALGSLDCDLVRASSGNEGLRALLRHDFAVMLLDVQMPGMDGYEMAAYARGNPSTRDVPIIFVTAMLEAEATALRGYGTGAVDFLFKPVNPYILRSKVQVFLDLYTSRRKLADTVAAHERTLADLEAFNYSVSHDLRAPLRPLDGFSQTLLEEYGKQLDETGRGYLTKIRSAAQRMGQLIDDLLRLSRIRAHDDDAVVRDDRRRCREIGLDAAAKLDARVRPLRVRGWRRRADREVRRRAGDEIEAAPEVRVRRDVP